MSEELPSHYPKREDVPWTDSELRLLHKVWVNVHALRFDEDYSGQSMYMSIQKAEQVIRDIAGMELGYSYGWLPEILAQED